MRAALYVVFFLSGAAGLIYESVWSRYLGLFVGHAAYAQVLVLTIFLGGMAIGAWVVGRWSTRLDRPLYWYAGIEFTVGCLGLLFHPAFKAVTALGYDFVFPHLAGSVFAVTLAKWGLAAALIVPQSVLLGATFPLMSAALLRREPEHAGRVLSWLYASNSFGGAIGVLVAGFYLVARVDFPGTLVVAATLNLLVALGSVGIVFYHRWSGAASAPAASPVVSSALTHDGQATRALLLAVTFGTAAASFVYEIAWIRMLSLVLGSATHSFELMLSAFILGLASGALWIRRRADLLRDPVRVLGYVQLAMGVLAVATLPLYVASFQWTVDLMAMFQRTTQGYAGFTVARYFLCVAVMFPATFCAGMTLPLITRASIGAGGGEGAVGEVYAMNTAGSIVGVQFAGLVFMPLLGVRTLLMAGATLDAAIGLGLLYVTARGTAARLRPLAAAFGAAVLVFGTVAWRARFDRSVLAAGVFRTGLLPQRGDFFTPFYRDGRTATVAVRRTPGGNLTITTNGKPDASLAASWMAVDSSLPFRTVLSDDEATQVLMPLIAMAHAPSARTVAVIGQGSGMTSHIVLASTALRELETIEIEPEMIAGSRQFFPINRRVFEDPRSHFVVDDAKAYFAASGKTFDLILSEPSNPWVSGVAGLFTAEFYHRIRKYMSPSGILVQWVHLYEMNDDLVRSTLAAVQREFPRYTVYMAGDADIVVVATRGAQIPAPDWSVMHLPGVEADLARLVPVTGETLQALWLADDRSLSPFVALARANSDYAPLLDLGGELARYLGDGATGFETLNVFSFDIAAALSERRVPFSREAQPSVSLPRTTLRSLGAAIRSRPTDAPAEGSPLAIVLERRREHDAAVRSGRPPRDWRQWVIDFLSVDRDVHAGTAGVLDSALYQPLDSYLRATDAPAPVRSAVSFMRAMDAWDWSNASREADSLLAEMAAGRNWISPDYLRDGGVVAKLKMKDDRGALSFFRSLLQVARRDNIGSFRARLLNAHIALAARNRISGGRGP